MKKLFKLYFKPSAIKARIAGDIAVLLAMLAAYIDVILPVIQQYVFGEWVEAHKGVVIVLLLSIKFLTNFTKKNGTT